MLAAAPTPVLGSTFSESVTRSADCTTYTFVWSYTMISGNPNVDFDIQTCGGSSWNTVINNGNNIKTASKLMSDLKGYSCYFG
jgi:hypothetical protein